jgi:hypothetical protein
MNGLLLVAEATEQIDMEQIIQLLQNFDYEALMASVEKFIGAVLAIVASISAVVLLIVTRFNKAKLALTGENFQEKANVEKANAIACETKDLIKDLKFAFTTVKDEHADELKLLRDELSVAKEVINVSVKSGTFSTEGLVELGRITERASNKITVVGDTFKEALKEATEKSENQGSILDNQTIVEDITYTKEG